MDNSPPRQQAGHGLPRPRVGTRRIDRDLHARDLGRRETTRTADGCEICKRDEHAIYFLTDQDSAQIAQANRFPEVTLTFADPGGAKFVAISGRAAVIQDRQKIEELWNPAAKAWWGSPSDPAIRVVKVEPDEAELWDSPGKLIAAVKMLTAAATGTRPSLGEKARVSI